MISNRAPLQPTHNWRSSSPRHQGAGQPARTESLDHSPQRRLLPSRIIHLIKTFNKGTINIIKLLKGMVPSFKMTLIDLEIAPGRIQGLVLEQWLTPGQLLNIKQLGELRKMEEKILSWRTPCGANPYLSLRD